MVYVGNMNGRKLDSDLISGLIKNAEKRRKIFRGRESRYFVF